MLLAIAAPLTARPALAAETLVSNGFESGVDGAVLASPWVVSGAPQRYEFDNARAKNGSLSAWIQGPATAAYAGVGETSSAGMTGSIAEQRFWVYFDSANQFRVIDDWSALTADRAFTIQFASDGAINVFTNRTGNPNGYLSAAYTPVGTYSAGWTEFRIVYDFASQSYTLSKRSGASDAWTQLKSSGATGYQIPFRGVNTVTQSHGLLLRAYQGANMWLDDVRFSDTGIVDADVLAPTAPASLMAADVAGDQGGSISLAWSAASDNVGVTAYKVYRGTASGVYSAPTTVFSLTSYVDQAAVTGTRYYYAVSALDAAGNEGPKGPEASAIALDDLAPAAPGGVSATGGSKQVALAWSANPESDLAGYNVYRAGVKVNPSLVTGTTYADTGLADGTTFSYTVKAVDASGNESPASAVVSASTDGTPPDTTAPAAPSGVSATGGTKQVTVTWVANTETDLAGYNVYRGGTKLNASLVAATTFTETGLADGTTYAYTVKAVDTTGNESAASASVSAKTSGAAPAANFDGTFEAGSDGAALSTPWVISGSAQRAEYDNARAVSGSMSGWIQGPATAAYAGVGEKGSDGMVSNGAEQRFWMYLDTTNQYRVIDDWSATTADRAFSIQFSTTGAINVFTNRVGDPNGYTTSSYSQVGTYTAGWTEFRVVYDFTSQTYTLSKRTSATSPWTELKASGASSAAIPFRGPNAITQSHGILWRAYQNTNMWLDDVRFSDSGIAEYTIAASAGLGGTISPTSQIVTSGSNSGVFTITPNTGYQIDSVLVDGVSVGKPSTYSFTNVTSAHTISAKFKLLPGQGDMPMTDVDCDTCHASHGFPEACGECHEMSERHPGTPSQMHVPAVVTACTPCHNASLTYEHNGRATSDGFVITCATCHQSSNPKVVAAIAAKNSACSACHEVVGHDEAHAFTSGSNVSASGDSGCTNSGIGCHGTETTYTTFTDYHPKTGCLSGACHTSVSQPDYAGNGDCQTCHSGSYAGAPARTDLPNQHYRETTHTAVGLGTVVSAGGLASATCVDCHNPASSTGPKGLVAQHTGVGVVAGSTYGSTVSCIECHNDTRANGNAQVLAGWTNHACSDCHSLSSSAPMHATTAPEVLATSSKSCGESGTKCHSTYDVHQLHKNAAGGCALAGCHDYTKQGAKPTVTTCGDAGGCHAQSGVDYHFTIAEAHTSSTVGSCFATGCHPASKDLAEVHAGYVGTGSEFPQYKTACDLCHNNQDPGRIDWSTANARCNAQCHSGSTHSQYAVAHTVTTASAECMTCHGSDLVAVHGGRSDTTSCSKCHTRPSNFSKTADCVGCHNGVDVGSHAYTPADPNHYSATSHAADPFTTAAQGAGLHAGGVECSTCHSAALSAAHSATSSSGGSVTCAECHTASTLGLKAFGSDSWPNRTCTSCHTPKAVHAAYATAEGVASSHKATSSQGCGNTGSSCHTTYEMGALHANAPNGCATCHAVDKSMADVPKTCGETTGCHTPASMHNGAHP